MFKLDVEKAEEPEVKLPTSVGSSKKQEKSRKTSTSALLTRPKLLSVVLEKTVESTLDCKEIQPVHSKGDQSWVFFGRNDAKAETPVLWPPHAKS